MDAGGYKRNEREREELATWNESTERGRERKKKSLVTERCENIYNLYINKI